MRGSWGGYYYEFEAADFSEMVEMPFYDITVPVPIGYKRILRSFYGEGWERPEQRDEEGVSHQTDREVGAPLPPCDIRLRHGTSLV